MNTNATKNTPKAAEKGREKAAAEQAAKKDTKTATKTAEKAERKEEKNMNTNATKNAAKNAPKTEATNAAEQKTATKATNTAEKIRAALEIAKTGSTREERAKAAEDAVALILSFNKNSLANAIARASFTKAAEAIKPRAPKKDESRRAGFTYANAEQIITYQYIDEEGHENTRTLTLVQYAVNAFTKTATKEQEERFTAALRELEKVTAAAIEGKEENGKAAARALTDLATSCGLDSFATKTAEDGKKYPFYIDRSFVYAAAAPLRVKRGEVKTAAAVLEDATLSALEAPENRRTKAEARRAKAEAAAVKAVFSIIAAAAEAAAVNVWKAYVKTAEGVREDWKKAAAEAAKREEERAATKAAREAKTADAKREKAAKLREQAAALEKAAAEQEKKTA